MLVIRFSILLIFISTGIFAATRSVPVNYSTITNAINASSSMDTILVGPGIYMENIVINGNKVGLKIFGIAGSSATTIDGRGISSVITINGNDSTDNQTILIGFLIQNGYGAVRGAGCYFNKTNVLLREVTIKNNILYGVNNSCKGAGLAAESSSVTIENSSIKGNRIAISLEAFGAGIGGKSSSISLKNCYVTYNISTSRDYIGGGGIHIWGGYLNINSCTIQNNSAIKYPIPVTANRAFGGGLMLIEVNADIVNTLITDNYVDSTVNYHLGAAIYIIDGNPNIQSKMKLSHCTIANNFGGLNYYSSAIFNSNTITGLTDSLIFTNCILWNYTTFEIMYRSIDTTFIINCDLKDTFNLGTNCIHSDPQFISTANYHLKPTSPCANMGLHIINVDRDNSIRPMPIGHLPDIGCFETDELNTGINILEDATNIFINTNGSRLIIKNVKGICNIFSLSGLKIYSVKLSENSENCIDLSHLQNNVYLVNVIMDDSKSINKKILRIN